MELTPSTLRFDLQCGPGSKPCGQACIPREHECQITGAARRKVAKAVGLSLAAGTVGALTARAVTTGAANRALQSTIFQAGKRLSPPGRPRMRLSGKAFADLKATSKTEQLHLEAKAANQAAERAMRKAAQMEVERAAAVGTAMYKSGKAARASLRSGTRRHNLTIEALRRKYEPGYRKNAMDSALTPALLATTLPEAVQLSLRRRRSSTAAS